jgi:hypothetical protein
MLCMTVHHCARGHHGGDDAACQCISYSDSLNYIVARGRWCTATHRNLERRPGPWAAGQVHASSVVVFRQRAVVHRE